MESIFEKCIVYTKELVAKALEDEDTTPAVTIGGTTIERTFEFIVRELPESVVFSDTVTSRMVTTTGAVSGHYRVEFNIAFDVWSKRKSLEQASFEVLRWIQKVFDAVALDKTLGGLCVHAEPYMDNGGTALDTTNKLFTAGVDCGIHVKAEIIPAVKEPNDGN